MAAGVGLKTVSRVVNDEPGVQAGTADRVRAAIDELGFRRNEGARELRRGRSASIGLVLENVADPFYSSLTRAVEEVAREHGFLVFTGSSGEDPEREREVALAFCARRVDGLVVVPAEGSHKHLVRESEAGTAVVFLDRPPRDLGVARRDIGVDTVLTDNAGGARKGVRHLLEYGHRRIGHIGDDPRIFTAAERLRGYRDALAEAGAPADDDLVHMGHPSEMAVRAALAALLDGSEPATALFTGNNRVTVAVLRELSARRAAAGASSGTERRPALVAFDDFELADLLEPAVTVVAQDPAGMGHTAARLLFRQLAEAPASASNSSAALSPTSPDPARTAQGDIELPTWLIPRGSGEIRP